MGRFLTELPKIVWFNPEMKIKVKSYSELKRVVSHFVSTASNIIIVGNPGLAKTSIVKQALNGTGRLLDGNLTAFQLYKLLHKHRDELIVIDDVDSLYADRAAVRLLKQACQTSKVKTVSWHSSHHAIGEVPAEFETESRFVIIANQWKTLNQNVSAIEDRGILIRFEPSAAEVHDYVSEWFVDDEVLTFISTLLPLAKTASARIYMIASELRQANLDWKRAIGESLGITHRAALLIDIESSGASPKEKARRYQEETGLSQPTYYRDKCKFQQSRSTECSLLLAPNDIHVGIKDESEVVG